MGLFCINVITFVGTSVDRLRRWRRDGGSGGGSGGCCGSGGGSLSNGEEHNGAFISSISLLHGMAANLESNVGNGGVVAAVVVNVTDFHSSASPSSISSFGCAMSCCWNGLV